MTDDVLPGFGLPRARLGAGFRELESGADGWFRQGSGGVTAILTPQDGKTEFIVFADKTLCYVKSAMGAPALYPLREASFAGPAEAVLMDLDGTSVHSEEFWIWIIEQTIARLLGHPRFALQAEDAPFVSGHSVSEHLQYAVAKYSPHRSVEEARRLYFEITRREMEAIMRGQGKPGAFRPAPGLAEFLLTLKSKGVRIGLVTSGLYEKAWPEITSAFRTLGLGDPHDLYDAVITAGHAFRPGQAGTLGELSPKPHPWLYAEAARVGLGIPPERRSRVVGIEDSAAGVVSIRLAGFAALGVSGGNIGSAGVEPLLLKPPGSLTGLLPLLLEGRVN